jgi:gas vesicle protein
MKGRKTMRKESVAALFVGGLVGAGVAMLVAPKSGGEVRERIGKFAEGARDSVKDYAHQGKARVVDLAERGRGYVRGRKTLVKTAYSAGKEAYVEERGRMAHKG